MKSLRTCPNGHRFYKSSDCPVCPVCEQENKPAEGFLSRLSAPARRALLSENIITEKRLSSYTLKEILSLHGTGKSAIPILEKALADAGLSFKKDVDTKSKR